MKKLGDSSYSESLYNMDNLVNEYNRTYRDVIEEKKEREKKNNTITST